MEPGPPRTLRDLIDKAKIKHDTDSLRGLARIGRAAGGELSHNTLTAMYNGDYRARPGRRILQEIADLAGVSYETAHEAAGLGKPARPFAAQLPERVDELTPKHRGVALVVIRALLDAQSSATDESSLNTDRVTTKEGVDLVWADEEGIFGPDGGSRSAQQM